MAAGHHHPRPAATPAPPTQEKTQQRSVLSFTNQEGGKLTSRWGGKLGVHLTRTAGRQGERYEAVEPVLDRHQVLAQRAGHEQQ